MELIIKNNELLYIKPESRYDTVLKIPDGIQTINRLYRGTPIIDPIRYISMSDSVKKLKNGCFQNMRNLEKIILSNFIDAIPANAFRNCKKLRDITIPKSVQAINSHAFANCDSLNSIIIPGSVQIIKDSAFLCTNLESIRIASLKTKVEPFAFGDISDLKKISIANVSYNRQKVMKYLIDDSGLAVEGHNGVCKKYAVRLDLIHTITKYILNPDNNRGHKTKAIFNIDQLYMPSGSVHFKYEIIAELQAYILKNNLSGVNHSVRGSPTANLFMKQHASEFYIYGILNHDTEIIDCLTNSEIEIPAETFFNIVEAARESGDINIIRRVEDQAGSQFDEPMDEYQDEYRYSGPDF